MGDARRRLPQKKKAVSTAFSSRAVIKETKTSHRRKKARSEGEKEKKSKQKKEGKKRGSKSTITKRAG
jgi:hypothetical protein